MEKYTLQEYANLLQNLRMMKEFYSNGEEEKTVRSNTEISRYFLTAYISEYFQVKEDDLKHSKISDL